jgi:hypothetical protein
MQEHFRPWDSLEALFVDAADELEDNLKKTLEYLMQ